MNEHAKYAIYSLVIGTIIILGGLMAFNTIVRVNESHDRATIARYQACHVENTDPIQLRKCLDEAG